jgi:hypothetical protein
MIVEGERFNLLRNDSFETCMSATVLDQGSPKLIFHSKIKL